MHVPAEPYPQHTQQATQPNARGDKPAKQKEQDIKKPSLRVIISVKVRYRSLTGLVCFFTSFPLCSYRLRWPPSPSGRASQTTELNAYQPYKIPRHYLIWAKTAAPPVYGAIIASRSGHNSYLFSHLLYQANNQAGCERDVPFIGKETIPPVLLSSKMCKTSI